MNCTQNRYDLTQQGWHYHKSLRPSLCAVLLFLLISCFQVGLTPRAFAAAGSNVLYPGESLTTGQSLRSANSWFSMVMQSDGNFVLYTSNGRALWQSGTGGRGGVRASMQTDGNLVVYTSANQPLWWSGTGGNAVNGLFLQNDGNTVIYNTSSHPIWYTATGGQFVQCWHVYHNGTVLYGGWLKLGTIHIVADVCANGQHVWLANGSSTPQCWVDNGYTGNAYVTWCGITWIGNWMQIGANMYTHATVNTILPINVDSHDWIRVVIFPDSTNDPGPTGGKDVWFLSWSMN